MTKPELGVKRDCPDCGARFYDLNKAPAHCPKCDHEFVPEALLKPRRGRKEDEEAPAPVAKPGKETPLEAADKEGRAAKSNRRPSLDEDAEDEDDDELAGIEDIDVDLDEDEEDDDSLLENDDDDDMTAIVQSGGGDDE